MSLAAHCHRRRLPGPLLQLTAALLEPLAHQPPLFTCRRRYLLAACTSTSNIPTIRNPRAGSSRSFHSPAASTNEKERHDRRQKLLETKVAKTVYWLLTHGGEKGGLNVLPDGYIPVYELLKHPDLHNVDLRTIEKVISQDGQQRFQLVYLSEAFKSDGTVPSNHWYIRARGGHTIPGVRIDLRRIFTPWQVTMAAHWTTPEEWAEIEKHGLRRPKDGYIRFLQSTDIARMRDQTLEPAPRPRPFIHWAARPEGSPCRSPPQPASERQHSVLIRLNVQKALEAGINLYLDYPPPCHLRRRQQKHALPPPVIVTKGNEMGIIGPEFFESVESVETSVKRVKIGQSNAVPGPSVPPLLVEESEAAVCTTPDPSTTSTQEIESTTVLHAEQIEASIPTTEPEPPLPLPSSTASSSPTKVRNTPPIVSIPSSTRPTSLSSRLRAASASASPRTARKAPSASERKEEREEAEAPLKSFRPQLQQGVRLLDRLKASSAAASYSPSSSYSTSTTQPGMV